MTYALHDDNNNNDDTKESNLGDGELEGDAGKAATNYTPLVCSSHASFSSSLLCALHASFCSNFDFVWGPPPDVMGDAVVASE